MYLPAGKTDFLGATPNRKEGGTNFAFYTSKDANRVELCLFDKKTGIQETGRFELTAKEDVKGDDGKTTIGYIWHGFAADVEEGALYGFRVHGPFNPDKGQYFNPYKVLIDPCAKAVTGELHKWDQRHFPHDLHKKTNGKPDMSCHDNADAVPKARVVDWQSLQERTTQGLPIGALKPHADTIIRELHVRGETINHLSIPENERGTYKALSSDEYVAWVKEMGYTTLELMPVESFGSDPGLVSRGKKNFWGYMTMTPTAPHTEYAANKFLPEEEFAATVRKLKQNGVEVIMDIVPNHTLESGPGGPLLNLRGMDNTLYLPHDYTGCGNTRDFGHPINRRMFLEELRYWQGLGVSGFRIDLATIIGREHGREFDPNSEMMKALRQDYGADHGLKNIKFYGEPWDLGPNGYKLGQLAWYAQDDVGLFGKDFGNNRVSEWNGKARDTLQTLLRSGSELTRGAIVDHMAGSSRHYPDPQASVIKITSHDDGTLEDMVTREQKNNYANGEDNRDGNHLPGTNWGAEAKRVQRFLMALLGLSQGVPMIRHGDERGHSADGNTNTYCQDNHMTHIPWGDKIKPEGQALMQFHGIVNGFRNKHSCLRRGVHFTGKPDSACDLKVNGSDIRDVMWLNEQGHEMQFGSHQWNEVGGFAMLLSGDPGNSPASTKHFTRKVNRTEHDMPLLVLVNPTMRDNMEFKLPDIPGVKWKMAINSQNPDCAKQELSSGNTIRLGWRSAVAFEGQIEKIKETSVKRTTGASR
jgi:glycogen operon protein